MVDEVRTFPAALWALQSMLRLESMPHALRLLPYIPSGCAHIPVSEYPEYRSLRDAGIVDAGGVVDAAVADWLTVISRPDAEVQMVIRRPGADAATIRESVTVITRMQCWVAGISRYPGEPSAVARQIGFDGDPDELPREWVDGIRIFPVADSHDTATQCAAITDTLIAELGECPPADIEGLNVRLDDFLGASVGATTDYQAMQNVLLRLGASRGTVEVLRELACLDRSALAAITARPILAVYAPHEQALRPTVSVADCPSGRLVMSQTQAGDGTWWCSVWPGHPAAVRADVTALIGAALTAPAHTH